MFSHPISILMTSHSQSAIAFTLAESIRRIELIKFYSKKVFFTFFVSLFFILSNVSVQTKITANFLFFYFFRSICTIVDVLKIRLDTPPFSVILLLTIYKLENMFFALNHTILTFIYAPTQLQYILYI